ncbi:MAG: hypothetical protein HY787_09885 [Deltaproteobacteria bacterium]|nr:hypothetical protein [Deltaproteobacteria bacterium]
MKKSFFFTFWLPFFSVIPFSGDHRSYGAEGSNVRLIGHSDLQGRDALQIVLKGNYAYVGHHRGREMNPLTGALEWNGTTILDVGDPAQPRIVKHLPGYEGAESRAVQVVEQYFDGRDYLLRNQESSAFTGFEVFDITERSSPRLVSKIEGLKAAHKSWWDAKTGYAYLSGTAPGWKGQHLIIYDLKNPSSPRFVSNWGLPGQAPGESGKRVSLHHPVISGDRAYLSYLLGGDVVILDIADKAQPKVIAHIDFLPPSTKSHTTSPFPPLRGKGIGTGKDVHLQQTLVVSEEALAQGGEEPRPQLYIFDATDEKKPVLLSTFKVPDADFPSRGGRFGPHQFAETKDGEIIGGFLLYVAYFNAGLRIVDVSNPSKPREVGYYLPEGTERKKEGQGLKKVIQTNDVDLDQRGLIYITDRSGAGLHILQFKGK